MYSDILLCRALWHVPGYQLHLIFLLTLRERRAYPRFQVQRHEIQRGQAVSSRVHSFSVAEPMLRPRAVVPKAQAPFR